MSVRPPVADQVLSPEQLLALQALADDVFVHHAVQDYAVRLVMATREPARWGLPDLESQIALGASPRATLGLLAAGRALALLRGRRFLVPQDIYDVAPEVLRHRLLLTYDGLAAGLQVDAVIARVLGVIPAPRVAPHQDEASGGGINRADATPPNNPQPWPAPAYQSPDVHDTPGAGPLTEPNPYEAIS
jgi:MoxR-like ATPase